VCISSDLQSNIYITKMYGTMNINLVRWVLSPFKSRSQGSPSQGHKKTSLLEVLELNWTELKGMKQVSCREGDRPLFGGFFFFKYKERNNGQIGLGKETRYIPKSR
jgi:hypothetical protein